MKAFTQDEVQQLISSECAFLAAHLISKNKAYGNSFADPVNIFSKCSPMEQMNVRLDDKIKRLLNRDHEAKRKIKEDTVLDLAGYLILKRVLAKMIREEQK